MANIIAFKISDLFQSDKRMFIVNERSFEIPPEVPSGFELQIR